MTAPLKKSILLIGDDRSWRMLLSEALKSIGELEAVLDEKSGLERIRERAGKEPYDVVAIDAHVSQDVPSLIKQVLDIQPNTKLVVASAAPHWKHVRKAFQAGVSDYIEKSEDEEALLRSFQSLLVPNDSEESIDEKANSYCGEQSGFP